jgi:hypothetical protein
MGVVGMMAHNGLDVLGLNAGGVEILHYCSDGPWGAPSVLYNAYRVFPGVKRPGHCVDHIPPSSPEAKERVEIYIYFPSGPSCLFCGELFFVNTACGENLNLLCVFK